MKKIHYSWVICFGGMLQMFLSVGLTITAFSVYQPYLISVVGLTNTQASMLSMLRNLGSLASTFLLTQYYARFNLRWGMSLLSLLASASFLVFAFAKGFGLCVVGALMAGISYGLGGTLAVSLLMNRWFQDRLGLSLGICSAGTGLSAVVAPPILEKIIAATSLKTAFLAEASAMTALTVLLFVLIRNNPAEKKTAPYRAPGKKLTGEGPEAKSFGIDKTGVFLMCIAMFTLSTAGNVGYSHYSVLYSTEGFSSGSVAAMLAVGGFALMTAKMAYGYITDAVGIRVSNVIFYSFAVIGIGLACLAKIPSVLLMNVSMLLLSIGVPISTVGVSLWAKDLSATERYPKNLQLFQMVYLAGSLFNSLLPGMIADCTGSYIPAFAFFTGTTALSFLCVTVTYLRYDRKRRLLENKEG